MCLPVVVINTQEGLREGRGRVKRGGGGGLRELRIKRRGSLRGG